MEAGMRWSERLTSPHLVPSVGLVIPGSRLAGLTGKWSPEHHEFYATFSHYWVFLLLLKQGS